MAKEILPVENIVLNARPADKWEAIRMAGNILVEHGYVSPDYVDDMIEREKSDSIYIGNNVAIPHGLVSSREKIMETGLSFIQTPEGITFGKEKAYMFIGIAGKGEEHMDMLAKIAMACSDLDNVKKLRYATDKKEIIKVLLEEEK